MDDQRTDREGGGVKLNKPIAFRFSITSLLIVITLFAVWLLAYTQPSDRHARIILHIAIAACYVAVLVGAWLFRRAKE